MKKNRVNLIALVVAVAVIVMAIIVVASGTQTYATFWALVPPIVAIGLALITKEVYSSLFVGLLVGSILGSPLMFNDDGEVVASTGNNITNTVDHVVSDGLIAAVSGTAGIFLFLVILGIIVSLINKAGGSAAFGRWAAVNIKSRIGAQLATFVLGVLIFIDDYFNCLTVGSVMRPIADSHKISRAKLAYLIDATAAPVCMIAPVSSWAAAVASYSEGTGMSGLDLFVRSIPFNFYSLLTFVFIICIVVFKADYGPMAKHEYNAVEKGDLFSTDERVEGDEQSYNEKGRVIDLIFPIALLIVVSVFALVYVGGMFDPSDADYGNFISAFADTDATVGLPWGAIIALVVIVGYLICRKLISFKDAMGSVPQGFIAMVPAITILTFATSLKNISNDLLGSAKFVEAMMKNAAPELANFLPAVIFIVACLLAFATGTSWGTFGILIPIVCNMFEPTNPLLFIGISACLAGAVCGDHCSPISDTTIMSSAGAQCVHVLHVSTQIPYAVAVAAISFVCFLIAGFVQNAVICLLIGIALIIGFLLFMRSRNKKSAEKSKK